MIRSGIILGLGIATVLAQESAAPVDEPGSVLINALTFPLRMGVLGWLISLLVFMASLFVTEVAVLLKAGADSTWRPSRVIAETATLLRAAAYHAAFVIGLLGDVFGFVRRFLLFLRDTFFRFIPREVILQALHDLNAAWRQFWRVPGGFIDGLWDAIKGAQVPWLAVAVLGFLVVFWIVAQELVALALGWPWLRTTHILGMERLWLYNTAWEVGAALQYVFNLKALVVRVLSVLFGFLPLELVRETTSKVFQACVDTISAPFHGWADGFCHVFACSTDNLPKAVLIPIVTVIVMLVIVVAIAGYINGASAALREARAEEEEEEEEEEPQVGRAVRRRRN